MIKNLFFISKFIIILYLLNLSLATYDDYIEPSQQFRGLWVTPLANDINTFKNKNDFIEKMNKIFDTIKKYNMNSLIFHVRIYNDALYNSKSNPKNQIFKNIDFSEFDPLQWAIEESHKKGIEFHAWMNPYRIKSNTKSIDEIIIEYNKYPNNPASQESNIMIGKDYFYLNPGLQNVRKFLVDTVLEFMSKYKEVDAIHFDDYFYNNDISSGGDENTYGESGDKKAKSDWRREQVDLLIESLHKEINNFNKENKKYIQFGISPSGIYKK